MYALSECSYVVETYEYDYLGNRTAKTSNGVTTEYVTDLSSGYSQVLKAETDTSAVYYTRGFELISRREVSTASYYIYDGGLSVRALTNEAGAVTDTLVFDAFGNETTKTGSSDNSYGFQCEEQDATGLYYLRARYMDPATGAFTTMDTYGGSLTDPMSLHKYLFANSNPVMYSDPSGHYTLTQQETAIAIQAIIGEAMSGIFYIADWLLTDPESQNHSVPMMIITMMIGLAQGAVMGSWGGLLTGLISKAGLSILDYLLTGIMFTLFSWDLKLAAMNMKESGNWLVAVLCDAGGDFAGVVAFASIYNGIAKGWNALKDKVPRNWTKNKKGYVNIGFKSEDNHNSNLNDTLNGVLNRTNYKKYDVDCSEIAEDFYVAANGEGEILHIESTQKTIFVNTYGIAEAYDYHEVYSYAGMIYDPRYSNVPVPKSQYFNMINDLNSGGFSVWTITN